MELRALLLSAAMVVVLFNSAWVFYAGTRLWIDHPDRASTDPLAVLSTGLVVPVILAPILALALPPIWIGRRVDKARFAHGATAGLIGWIVACPVAIVAAPLSMAVAFVGAPIPSGYGQAEGILALVVPFAGVLLTPLMGGIASLSGHIQDRRVAKGELGPNRHERTC